MTWQNPRLADAALQWRIAQNAVARAKHTFRVSDEERSAPLPGRPGAADVTALERHANQALAECLRLARQADRV